MLFDKEGLFSNKQVAGIDALSEQTVDLYKGDIRATPHVDDDPRDLGRGNPVPIRVQLVADAAAAVTATILVGDAIDGSNDIVDPTTLGTITVQGLLAGSWGEGQFLPHGTYGRYMQLQYDVECTVTSGIVTGHDQASHT